MGVVGETVSSAGSGVGMKVEVGEGETSVGRNDVAVGRDAAPTSVGVASALETPT